MATANPTITFDSTSDANFRTWGSAVSSALQTCGLVQTSDTGQINWTTVTRTAAAYTGGGGAEVIQGYEIYKFNDSLQATFPVFIKVEYGYIRDENVNGAGVAVTAPVLYVNVAASTNGSGTLNGTMIGTRTRVTGGPAASINVSGGSVGSGAPSASSPCYFSGNGSYINLAFGVTTAAQPVHPTVNSANHAAAFPAFLTIERSLDGTGAIINSGVYFLTSKWVPTAYNNTPSSPTITCQMLSYGLGAATTVDSFWPISWPGEGFSTGTYNSNVMLWPLLGYTGTAFEGLAMMGQYNSDIACATTITTSILGSNHTYLSLAGISTTRYSVDNTIPSAAALMRYE